MRTPSWVGALLVLLLAALAVAPLAYPGFYEASSGFVAPFRLQAPAGTGLLDVAGPVRGEGSLAYYVVWPLLKLTGSGIVAIKWGYALSFLLGALALYGWARLRLGTEGAVLASAVYTYLPWHLATVYLRGAYAEAWLWALWPAVLLAWEAPLRRARWLLRLAGTGVAGAALLVQPGLAFVFLDLTVPYAVAVWRVRWWPARAAAALLGIGLLAAGGWIAAGAAGEAAPDGFLWPFQLLSAAWPTEVAGGDLPYQLGAAAVILSIVTLGLWAIGRWDAASLPGSPTEAAPRLEPEGPAASREGRAAEHHAADDRLGSRLGPALGFWGLALLAVLLLTQHLSSAAWDWLRLGGLVSHPWQLLLLTGLPLAFLSGACVRLDRRLAGLPMWAGLVALVILSSYGYLSPRFTQVDPGAAPVAVFTPEGQPASSIHLLEAEWTPAAEITSTLILTLTWQALAPVDADYSVFVHLLSGEDKLTQADSWPCSGDCPTHEWRPGQILLDVHEVALPPGPPPGPYRVALGLYEGNNGERLVVSGRDDGTVYLDVR